LAKGIALGECAVNGTFHVRLLDMLRLIAHFGIGTCHQKSARLRILEFLG
jgi:hypothetical protein